MNRVRVASARQVLLDRRPLPVDDQVRLENSFFRNLCLPNGTRKTTSPARLVDVDQLIADHVEGKKAVRLLDVGISSGVTTIELLDSLAGRGVQVSGVGVDICVRGRLCALPGIDVLYDSAEFVLQISTPLFTRGRPTRGQRSLLSRLLRVCIRALELKRVRRWALSRRWTHQFALVSPRLARHPRFQVVEHDISRSRPEWYGAFDVIRAANVLNLDYFPPAKIASIIENLMGCLGDNGLLVVCRTSEVDGRNHGSIFQKGSDSTRTCRRVQQFGDGSELDPLFEATFLRDRDDSRWDQSSESSDTMVTTAN
jgi:hypothetical protein